MRAKEDMRLAREKVFKMSQIRRVGRDIKQFDLWYWFARPYMDILKTKKPDFATENLEEEFKKSREQAEKEREEWRRGVNFFMETYEQTGKEPPGEDNPHPDSGDFFVQRQCSVGQERRTSPRSGSSWSRNRLKMSRMIGTTIGREEQNSKGDA